MALCNTCKYFVANEEDETIVTYGQNIIGICKRFPPKMVINNIAVFPVCKGDSEQCGEYQAPS